MGASARELPLLGSGIQCFVRFERQRSTLRLLPSQLLPAACWCDSLLQLSVAGHEGLKEQRFSPPDVLSSCVFRSPTGSRLRIAVGLSSVANAEIVDQSVEVSWDEGEEGVWSVIIPTYNRLPILTKCLQALEEQKDYEQSGVREYEVVVVDDGSTDGTVDYLAPADEPSPPLQLPMQSGRFSHVTVVRQQHAGATKARNLGLRCARGSTIVFIDSDMVVTAQFLRAHSDALKDARNKDGDDRAFTYGRVVNTANFEDPRSEPFKLSDMSAAFFATGNVAISRHRLLEASKLLGPSASGPFDSDFSEYGWEDLELGERLRQGGARIQHAPAAVGYHWHPAFGCEQIPKLVEQERERGRNGARFYCKHPNLNVRLMIQMTPFHEWLWFWLTLGGLVNERTLEPLLRYLVASGNPSLAAAILSPTLNRHTVHSVKEEVKRLKACRRWCK